MYTWQLICVLTMQTSFQLSVNNFYSANHIISRTADNQYCSCKP